MQGKIMVTGASGHLGRNLLELLREKNESVLAVVRDERADVPAQKVVMDLRQAEGLVEAMQGVAVVIHAAAVFQHWARNPERDIYQANLQMTENVIKAAVAAGVKKVVYVSSLGAADRHQSLITEAGWNKGRENVYFRAKTDAEKLAWQLCKTHKLEMSSVLPATMVGPHCERETPSMSIFRRMLENDLPIDPGFLFNFVQVEGVARACYDIYRRDLWQERFLLANEDSSTLQEIADQARKMFPNRGIRRPRKVSPHVLRPILKMAEIIAGIRGEEPPLQTSFLDTFTVRERCDCSLARDLLGFAALPSVQLIERGLWEMDA